LSPASRRENLIRAADTRTLSMPATTARLAAPGSITNGQFGLFRWDMNPGSGGASAHIHKTFSESLLHALGSWLLDEHVYQKRYLPRFRSSHAQAAKLASDPSALQKDEDAAKTLLARVCLTGKVNSTGTNYYDWCLSDVRINSPAGANEVDRLQADSKFFRSMVFVFLLAALVSFREASVCISLVATALALFAIWRFCELRWTATKRV